MIDSEFERPGLATPVRVTAIDGERRHEKIDDVATEEPLEIRLAAGGRTQSVAVTMRTPGNDFELAAGFLFSEGIVRSSGDLSGISYCIDPQVDREQRYNIVNVALAAPELPQLERLERYFTTSSACGVCGKASIDALATRARRIEDDLRVSPAFIAGLPQKMRDAQRVFASTGGLHAAALFDRNGELLVLREDVGRHNAVDKILGWALLAGRVTLRGCVLLVSGRASFELVQKSIVAGIPVLCAVSAPSSLAVELAKAFGLTLAGFVRGDRANVYSEPKRVR
ncbi:MAG TPA: formate dehydrogenase accessory sulfurtransferase FdhD [Candidatus Baltobacteraceae bacterium]|jgi:FdhD protein|nr:formate dehydrogenase accessory sulfurtransferase FdhD [Candidatus Baltobacteraceae bacterium]